MIIMALRKQCATLYYSPLHLLTELSNTGDNDYMIRAELLHTQCVANIHLYKSVSFVYMITSN